MVTCQELMKKIYEYAEDYYFSEGYSPSTSEIANAIGIARTTAYNYLVAMDKLGMVDYDGKLIATEKIRKTGAVNHGVKIYDNAIPCGELETIESSVSEYVDLPASIFGNGELFILRTRGESMIAELNRVILLSWKKRELQMTAILLLLLAMIQTVV